MANRTSLRDTLANLTGEALADIRSRVLDEAWFHQPPGGDRSDYEQFFKQSVGEQLDKESRTPEHARDWGVDIDLE